MPARTPLALVVLALLLGFGCRSAADDLKTVAAVDAGGEPEAVEAALRDALERHPDDVDLLLWGAEFYLRARPEEFYRPRLALHYAMRADKAADYRNEAVARTLIRAWRGTGGAWGTEEGRRLLQEGLKLVRHPDSGDPVVLEPVDPDLLDPTIANAIEQMRRKRLAELEPCDAGLSFVPAGTYPAPEGGAEITVQAFCVEHRKPGGLAQFAPDEAARAGVCRAFGKRLCSADEAALACGPLRTILGPHPACEEEAAVRCCGEPRDASGRAAP